MNLQNYKINLLILIYTFTFTFQCSENVLEQVQNFSPNTPPEVTSFGSDSPGAGLVAANQTINISFSATDLHKNTFTATIVSTQGLFGQRNDNQGDNLLAVTVPFTVTETQTAIPIMVDIILTDEKGATATYSYDLGSILPNVPPVIVSATSNSPGGATLLPNQVIQVTVEGNDPHNDPIVFSYASLVGAFSGQVESVLPNGNTQSAVSFYISNSVIPGFIGDITITLSDNRGGVTTQTLNLGTGKQGPAVTATAVLPPFISSTGFSTLSFSADSNGFFQYTINNITGVNPVPNCSVNFASGFFAFYDMTLTPVINIDLIGSGYAGTASGASFSLNIPAADGIYQVCAGVIDTLMQFNFLGGVQGVSLTQDSQPPVTSFTTPPASYSVTTSVPVACTDNVSGCDLSAYTTSTSTTTLPPAAPAPPAIDPVTHTVTAGTLYSAPLTLADATQTTVSAISLDLASNLSALQTGTYIIDTTVPVITINGTSTSVISSVAGYDIATLTWSTNRTNLNYTVKSGIDCTTGTPITGLSGLTPATANTAVTNLINAAQLTAGANTIWVCVDNLAALTGSSSHVITRDNTAPSISLTPLPANFTAATNLAMTCTDTGGSTCAVTGYTKSTSTTPALPAAPATPALVAATKTVAAGTTQYTTPVTLADATQTLVSYIAMDNVGNISTVTTTATPYIVETALPTVTVSATTVNAVSSTWLGPTAPYDIAAITWSANRTNLNYIVKNGTCATGTPVANSTAMLTPNLAGVTPATANTSVVTLVNQADLANGANSISICVTNLALNDGAANFTLNKDITPPTVSISPAAGPNSSPLNFTITCSDAGVGCKDTDYYVNTAAVANYAAGSITTAGLTSNGVITHIGCLSTVYTVKYAARDNNMILSTGTASYTLSDCKVKMNLAMTAPAVYTANSLSVKVDNGTSLATSTMPLAATGLSTSTTIFKQGDLYHFSIAAQPANQVCSVTGLQFGTIGTADVTLNIDCVAGQINSGNFLSMNQTPLGYPLYQGKVTQIGTAITSTDLITTDGTNIYSANDFEVWKINISTGTTSQFIAKATYPGTCTAGVLTTPGLIVPVALVNDGTNLYIADMAAHAIFKYRLDGTAPLIHFAGKGDGCAAVATSSGLSVNNTDPLLATFDGPNTMVIHKNNLYVGEWTAGKIRKIDLATGYVTNLITGTPSVFGITAMNTNGVDYIYFSQYGNDQIHRVNISTGALDTWYAGTGVAGYQDGSLTSAMFKNPSQIATDGTHIYVADRTNCKVRKIDMKKNLVSTIAGSSCGTANYATAKTGIAAVFTNSLRGITTDGRNLFTSDTGAGLIAKITDNGLVGYWPLAENANDYNSDNPTAAPGNINNGTSTAWPTVTASSGRLGIDSTYIFNGTSQFITATNSGLPTGNVDFTVSAWVKTQQSGSGQKDILGNRNATGGQYDYSLIFENNDPNIPGQTTFARNGNGGASVCRSVVRIDDAKFHHILGSKKGTIIYLYIDGKLMCQTTDITGATTPGNIVFGSRSTAAGLANFFNGSIADVRIYNRALNEGEINELAQDADPALVGPSYNTAATGLLSHYKFDDADGAGPGLIPSLADSGPLNYLLTNTAAATAIGKDGDANGAYLFTNATDILLFTGSTGLPLSSHGRTLCAWVNLAQYVAANQLVAAYGAPTTVTNTSFTTFGIGIGATGTVQNWTGAEEIIGTHPVPLNKWTHLCINYDGGTNGAARTYINGSLEASGSYTLATPANSNLLVGVRQNVSAQFFGKIDDVRIYNHALSGTEVRQLATQVPNGLLARYDFTGDANDVSGFGNTMTTNTATPATDRHGLPSAAYNFGASKSMKRQVFSSSITNVTLTGWVRWLGANGNIQIIMHNGDTSLRGYGLVIDNITGKLTCLQAGGLAFNTGYTVPAITWTHIAATIVGASWNVYANGTLVYTGGAAPNAILSTDSFMVGMTTAAANQEFNGDIDDVRVYNRVLSQPEIAAMQ